MGRTAPQTQFLRQTQSHHTKNFAFTMDQQGKWAISPAYDVCHAYRPDSPWVTVGHLPLPYVMAYDTSNH
ncbi:MULTISPECIES: HipA domain-containing protein [unclassified Mucilaginibacter]|uniref:HipA domain-containing protein n=1 Tax=unclassified Mucilaginibacter TaxID=2617802 RepID=UPI002B23D33C|nr:MULTISPECIES: HipA domain-containing protein [unclassified Mucilaginibacter]